MEDYSKLLPKDKLIKSIEDYKKGALDYQQRRHDDWDWNYELYRDKTQVDQVTQRQGVTVPLMKETLSTVFAQIDDAPDIKFEQRSDYPIKDFEGKELRGYKNNQKEILLNAYWKYDYERMRLGLIDAVDKKQCLLFARSFKKIFIGNDKRFHTLVISPRDILVDRYVKPECLDSAHFISHINIFKTIGELKNNPLYDKKAIKELEEFAVTDEGVTKTNSNAEQLSDSNRVMRELGDETVDNPTTGEAYFEISENYTRITDEDVVKACGCEKDGFVWWFTVLGANDTVLASKPLKDIVRVNFIPFVSWATDVEANDFWSDGPADIVRGPNRVLNAWFSQLVENRTLRNYGMNYFDATIDEFDPTTFKPTPWGWYGLPGKPKDIVQRVDIPDLSESLDEMQFVMGMVEKATAATAIQKGGGMKSDVPLGVFQMLNQNAMNRATTVAKYYRQAWKDYAEKWYQLLEANADWMPSVEVYKRATSGKMIGKKISPRDWRDKEGYEIRVVSSSEQDQENIQKLQQLNFAAQSMPTNPFMRKIFVKKVAEMTGASTEEVEEIVDFEMQQMGAQNSGEPLTPQTQGQAADQMGLNQDRATQNALTADNAGMASAMTPQAAA